MSSNYEKSILGNNEELLYWMILKFYREIWRMHKKKTNQPFRDLGF
jgi:hypothetical protein